MKPFAAALLLLAAAQLSAQTTPKPPPTLSQQVAHMEEQLADWPNLHRYAADNAALPAPAPGETRIVFYGDSITDGWGRWPDTGAFFPGKAPEEDARRATAASPTPSSPGPASPAPASPAPAGPSPAQPESPPATPGAHPSVYLDRGISGQTTPQMLVRFEQDVVQLHPAAVLILAGTNDIAGNTGPSTPQMTEDNFAAMAAIARANGIKVILASILPAYSYPWKPGINPVPTIREINQWLKDYCAQEGFTYLDYYSAMSDEKGAMKPGLAKDQVHPTSAGYAIMGPLAEAAIAKALQK